MWRFIRNCELFGSVDLEVLIVDLCAATFRLEKHLHDCRSPHEFREVLELEKTIIDYSYWTQHRIAATELTIGHRQVLGANILDFRVLIDLKVKNFAPLLDHFR